MKFVIITGMSGAGKSSVIKTMEDMGYFCVDNMPVALITKFTELCESSYISGRENVAFVIDARGGEEPDEILAAVDELKGKGYKCNILFLDSNDETLVARYKETRRSHPSSKTGVIIDGINYERVHFAKIREKADYVFDTSGIKVGKIKSHIKDLFDTENEGDIKITVMSFGFKNSAPRDADLVFDVRFLPNPFYVPELKDKVGTDKDVYDYVFDSNITKEFVSKLEDIIEFTMPYYIEEGKHVLTIGIGCTGGHHRSVAVAETLCAFLKGKGYKAKCYHRDIEK